MSDAVKRLKQYRCLVNTLSGYSRGEVYGENPDGTVHTNKGNIVHLPLPHLFEVLPAAETGEAAWVPRVGEWVELLADPTRMTGCYGWDHSNMKFLHRFVGMRAEINKIRGEECDLKGIMYFWRASALRPVPSQNSGEGERAAIGIRGGAGGNSGGKVKIKTSIREGAAANTAPDASREAMSSQAPLPDLRWSFSASGECGKCGGSQHLNANKICLPCFELPKVETELERMAEQETRLKRPFYDTMGKYRAFVREAKK